MKEGDLQRLIQLEASRLGARLWRNNVGMLYDHRGVPVRYGLCEGSADLVGFVPRGGVAVFCGVEVKTPTGRASPIQEKWLECVVHAGGIAGVCRSVDDLDKLLRG